MKYVSHETGEDGCIFCNRLASEDDTKSLILRRTDLAFVIMNLFPYNTGHVMIVPNRHVADLEDLMPEELNALGSLLPETLAALRRVLNPSGFNVGINIGAVAGAGVADHLHQHVVPRWQGDANFMPIIAGTTVMPELIPATYAKVRAELERSHLSDDMHSVALIVLSCDATRVLTTKYSQLPTVDVKPTEAIFQAARDDIRSLGVEANLVGWAGSASAKTPRRAAFAFLASPTIDFGDKTQWVPIQAAPEELRKEEDREALRSALRLDLQIAAGPQG